MCRMIRLDYNSTQSLFTTSLLFTGLSFYILVVFSYWPAVWGERILSNLNSYGNRELEYKSNFKMGNDDKGVDTK